MSQEATPGTEKTPAGPSGIREAMSMYAESQAAAAAAEAKPAEGDAAAKVQEPAADTKPAETVKPESTPADKGGAAAAGETDAGASAPVLRLVNEKGEVVALPFKADGKDLTEADIGKIRQYVERGYHGSQRDEAINAKEKLLEERLKIIEVIQQAQAEGRLVIKEKGDVPPGSADKPAEDDDLLADPKVKELSDRVAKNEKDLKEATGLIIKQKIEEGYKAIKGEIAAKQAEFPHAREAEVWRLLELQDATTGKPVHDVASAMKAAHESELNYLMTAPLPEKRVQTIIGDYIAKKAKAEEAPAGAPAGAAPGAVSAAAKAEEKPITGIADAMERYKKSQAVQGGAASQF